jgi:hypothetical protein
MYSAWFLSRSKSRVYYLSTYAKVRRLFHRDRLSVSEIQRRTSLSRNTIKAWLKETSPAGYKLGEAFQFDRTLVAVCQKAGIVQHSL